MIPDSTATGKLRSVWGNCTPKRRFQFFATLVVIVGNSCFEILSLASLIPFLSVLSDSNRFWGNINVRLYANLIGIHTASEAIPIICIAFAVITILGTTSRTVTIVVASRFTMGLGLDLSRKVFERTLHQPYSAHASQNSAVVVANVTQNVAAFIGGVLNPLVQLLTNAMTVIGILSTLFLVNWWVACTASVIFGGAYACIARINKPRFEQNSNKVLESQDRLMKALQEGIGAIRDVVIDGNQEYYIREYSNAERQLRIAAHDSYIRSNIPKHFLEAAGMVLISVVAYILSNGDSTLLAAVPVLGVIAMSAQRLLPAMQNSFASYASIVANMHGLDRIVTVLRSNQMPIPPRCVVACGVKSKVSFNNVDYQYTPDGPIILSDVSFDIHKGERIGITGTTGSGKSTTMDLLLGLLIPTSGEILIDDAPLLGHNVFAWQKSLSHVPQTVYLADVSITENIAFGLPVDQIDMDQVRMAARLAQIAEHIESLEAGYDTFVGERGIRLSGGQRQRIGIARALYKNATVLVFDEATSALDDETEADLMKAIDGLSKDITIVMIAHRLSTVRRCDKILKLHKGKVVAFDTPDIVLGPVSNA